METLVLSSEALDLVPIGDMQSDNGSASVLLSAKCG